MPPNTYELSDGQPSNIPEPPKMPPSAARPASRPPPRENLALRVVRSLVTMVVYIITGILVGVAILFAFRGGTTELNATNQHIILCVIGYHFLMAQAILCLAPDSWTSGLNLKHRRWMHWFLQILGSGLAVAGSFIKILDKSVHWNTLHGQFGLVALVFTTVSFVNGLASMFASPLRRKLKIPPLLSKLTHICFGIVAMGAASFTLCYGFDKTFFRTWATTQVADALIVMTGIFTCSVIIHPFLTLFTKAYNSIKK